MHIGLVAILLQWLGGVSWRNRAQTSLCFVDTSTSVIIGGIGQNVKWLSFNMKIAKYGNLSPACLTVAHVWCCRGIFELFLLKTCSCNHNIRLEAAWSWIWKYFFYCKSWWAKMYLHLCGVGGSILLHILSVCSHQCLTLWLHKWKQTEHHLSHVW